MSIFKKDSVSAICADFTSRLEKVAAEQQQNVDKAIADVHEAKSRLHSAQEELVRAESAIDKIKKLFGG